MSGAAEQRTGVVVLAAVLEKLEQAPVKVQVGCSRAAAPGDGNLGSPAGR